MRSFPIPSPCTSRYRRILRAFPHPWYPSDRWRFHARPNMELVSVHVERSGNRGNEFFSNDRCRGIIRSVLKDDQEFVAALAGDGILRSDDGAHSRRHLLQKFVADVALWSRSPFELVEIDEHMRKTIFPFLSALAKDWESLSMSKLRFGNPVSSSCVAFWRIFPTAFFRSVMSVTICRILSEPSISIFEAEISTERISPEAVLGFRSDRACLRE